MRLDRLHIRNFRCYEDATFDFQPGFNLVVGVNGSGKTSLLQAIAVSFIEFGNAVKPSQISIKDEDIRFVIDRFENRSRFERQYPLLVQGTGVFFWRNRMDSETRRRWLSPTREFSFRG